jgi:hypothetical protein
MTDENQRLQDIPTDAPLIHTAKFDKLSTETAALVSKANTDFMESLKKISHDARVDPSSINVYLYHLAFI